MTSLVCRILKLVLSLDTPTVRPARHHTKDRLLGVADRRYQPNGDGNE